jgi:dolichol-phosphate mannosyltransferase
MKISAVIPAKNEAKTILGIVEKTICFVDEVIVVIAEDFSEATLSALDGCEVTTIFDRGIGKGNAIKCGSNVATGDVIVFLDADGSHIPDDIPRLVEPLKVGEADLVIASRTLGGSEEFTGDVYKRLRVFFSDIITLIINLRFGSSITDSQNGFRAIRGEVLRKLNLRAKGFDVETEMLMKCLKKGYKVTEVPSRELKRKYGKSGIKMLTMGWRYAWRVLVNLL